MPKRKHLSVCKDACPGLLNLYPIRILTVRSQMSIRTFAVLVSCTTISVYVNLSKSVLQKERIKGRPPHKRGGFTSFAGAKVRFFRKLAKLFETFFKKR